MKKYILLIFLVLSVGALKAQTGFNYNYSPYAIGFGISSTRAYTNVDAQTDNVSTNIGLTYNYSPYIPFTAEIQVGRLSGGSTVTDRYKRQYLNNYQAFVFHADLMLGEIIDYRYSGFSNFMKNFYGGTGFGFVNNNLTVQRTAIDEPSYVFPGSDHSVNFMLPFRVGYELKFFNFFGEPNVRLNLAYEHNFVFGEGLDGYNDPSNRFKNNHTNQYRQIMIGVRFDFGVGKAYTKIE